MANQNVKCYILVKSHTDGMALFEFLKSKDFDARVAPSPREARSECGMSVLCDCEQIDLAINTLKESGLKFEKKLEVKQTFDVNRFKFC